MLPRLALETRATVASPNATGDRLTLTAASADADDGDDLDVIAASKRV